VAEKKWWEFTRLLAQQIPAFDIPKDFAKNEVKFLKHVGADAFFMFVELDGQYIWPSKFGPMYKALGKRDLLRELVSECHENGFRFIAAFMGQHCQTALSKKHPGWVFKGFKDLKENKFISMGPTCLCLNSPYRQLLQGMVREVITDYGVDGIYFDGVYYPAHFCFCDGCRKKYADMFGKEMPLKLRDKNRLKLGEETIVGWSREIRRLINETNPDVCYALDCHATLIGHSDSREYIHKTHQYVDVRIQECYPEVISEQPYYAEMENLLIRAETAKPVWWAKWIARNPDTNVVTNPPAAIKLWGSTTLATKSPVFFVLQRVTDFDKRCIPPMKEIAALWKKAKPSMADAETVAPIALFHSIESKLQRLPVKARDYRKYFEGWYLALKNQHIPFDILSEVTLSADTLKKYSALILPNTRYMSENTIRIVREFVERGGALIASGFSSFSDENGKDRGDFALGDVFRAKYTGTTEGVRQGKLRNRVLTQYYKAFAKHPISKGLEDDFYSFRAGMQFPVVELARGAKAIFRKSAYDADLVKTDRYFIAYPTEKPADVVLAVSEKPHRVVYMPAPLDGAFWEFGWPELAEIMARAARWALGGKLPLETDAEENIWITPYRNEKKKSWVLHLNNQGVNNQYSIGFDCCFTWDKPDSQSHGHPVRRCFKTAAFSVTLRGTKSKKLSAKSLTGKKITLKKSPRGWTINHPGISEYDVILLQEK